MGLYDTFGNCQIKAGPCDMSHYKIGDDVPLRNGVYVSYEGVVVIVGGKFVAEYKHLYDKWGGVVEFDQIITERNPIVKAMRKADRE